MTDPQPRIFRMEELAVTNPNVRMARIDEATIELPELPGWLWYYQSLPQPILAHCITGKDFDTYVNCGQCGVYAVRPPPDADGKEQPKHMLDVDRRPFGPNGSLILRTINQEDWNRTPAAMQITLGSAVYEASNTTEADQARVAFTAPSGETNGGSVAGGTATTTPPPLTVPETPKPLTEEVPPDVAPVTVSGV